MILIIGIKTDRIIRKLTTLIVSRNEPCLFVNVKKLGGSIVMNMNTITVNDKEYSWSIFTGVYHRIPGMNSKQKYTDSFKNNMVILAYALNFVLKNVINKPLACIRNNFKVSQLDYFELRKIKAPRTIIKAKSGRERLPNRKCTYINKSLSSVRSIVQEYSPDAGAPDFHFEPVQFQCLIPGSNIRVHVIGKNTMSIRITSNKVDYRYDYDGRDFKICDIPKAIENECIHLAEQSGLIFCGVDLIFDGHEYYILEINPTPGYLFFEENVQGNAMSEMLLHALKGNA